MSQPKLNFCLTILITLSNYLVAKSDPLATALYIFGDSLVDNGNNNWLLTVARANYAPYSQDFPCAVTPGRFTNGRTFADFLAEYFRLPYPPPYASLFGPNRFRYSNPTLNKNLFTPDSVKGYNYASAACGILPETGSGQGECYSFDEQIEMFQQTIEKQLSPIFEDPTKLSESLSKSIFVVCMGSNDYLNNYFLPLSSSRKAYEPPQFAQLLMVTLAQQLQRLYDLGARKIVVTEIGPLGCTPTGANHLGLKPAGKCDVYANEMLMIFNKLLPYMLNYLTSTLQGSYFILAHVYTFLDDAIANPANYGFKNSSSSCCTTFLNGTFVCIPELPPCPNPNDYIFWDGYHPSQAFYSLLAKELFYGSSLCSPINLNRLVQL